MTAACPACAVPLPDAASAPAAGAAILLHLPDIHCAACIASVEEALGAVRGVTRARVNLTQKRASVEGQGVSPAALVAALAAAGHRAQELDASLLAGQSDEMRDLLMRIGVAGFAMMNVMLLSVAVWSGAAETTARLFHLISAAIAIPAIAFAGRPFFAAAWRALSRGRLNMDVPISVAIVLASLVSLAGALGGCGSRRLVRRGAGADLLPADRTLSRPGGAARRALGRGRARRAGRAAGGAAVGRRAARGPRRHASSPAI